MKPHIKLLIANDACSLAIEYAARYSTMTETIANCDRINWLRWALQLLPTRECVRHACYIVRNTPTKTGTVWDLITDERSRTAIETAERWVDGLATDEELKIAYDAASAAYWSSGSEATRAAALAAGSNTWAARAAAWAAASAAADEWQAAYIKTIDWSFCDQRKPRR